MPLVPFGLKAGVAGMTMLYSLATGQYVISLATVLWMLFKFSSIAGAVIALLFLLFAFKGAAAVVLVPAAVLLLG